MAKTFHRCTVGFHFTQPFHIPGLNHPQFFPGILPVIFFALQKEPVDYGVLGRIVENTLCRFPVTSGPAGLLIVIFHALRHIVMQYKAYV